MKWIGGDTVHCVSVCEYAHSKPFNQTVGALNANSSKMVKATDFKFDTGSVYT